ncbi:hypothetical protein ECG_06475 [Echinococcus granulosus]|uniref:Bestrophin 3 n=1 Tax=Echinococcus granulosus TaxID=6210 RepID=A0A068WH59_ECHGR|nr:hypothetical protein ECG_06475 [Echinococcus granulosus]CDS19436.1 bestrophin 3 [Echinococcus granulosus]
MSVLLTRIKPQLEDTKYLHTNHSYSITRRRMLDPNIAREILKLLDFDGSGTVKTSDLHEAFMGTGLSEADVNEFIRKYDKGNKGKINLEELTAMLDSVHRKTNIFLLRPFCYKPQSKHCPSFVTKFSEAWLFIFDLTLLVTGLTSSNFRLNMLL